MNLTIQEVKDAKAFIINNKLIVPDWFWALSNQDIQKAYNGVGNESMYKPLRQALTWVFRFSIEAVIIHDVIFHYADFYNLNKNDFYQSNLNLKLNAKKCLWAKKYRYPFTFVWQYIKCELAQMACNRLGFKYFRVKPSTFQAL